MSDRSEARVTFLDLITSRWALSWQAWAVVVPISLLASLLRNFALFKETPLPFLAVAAAGQLVVLAVLLVGDEVRSRVSPRQDNDLGLVIAVWIAAGVAFGASQVWGRSALLEQTVNAPLIVARASVSTFMWLALATFLIAIYKREEADRLAIQRLVAATEQATIAAEGDVSSMRLRLRDIVRRTLVPELQRLALQVRTLATTDTPSSVATTEEAVRALSSDVVRRLSHEFSDLHDVDSFRSLPPPPPPTWWDYVYASRPNVVLTLIVVAPFAFVQPSPGAYVDVLLQLGGAFLALFVGTLVCRTAWAAAPPVGFAVTVLSWFGVFAAAAVVGLVPLTPLSGGPAAIVEGFVGAMFAVAASVYTSVVLHSRATRAELTAREAELSVILRQLDEESARLREQVALALHGPVQSRLTAMSMAMRTYLDAEERGEHPSLPELVSRLSSMLDSATDDLESMFTVDQSESAGLGPWVMTLVDRWQPLLDVDVAIAPDVEAVLSDREDVTALVRECLDDAVTNASRHGRARHVGIWVIILGDRLRLVALDDGVGPVADIRPGLCARRVMARRGEWSLLAQPGGGAELSITIPLEAVPRPNTLSRRLTGA